MPFSLSGIMQMNSTDAKSIIDKTITLILNSYMETHTVVYGSIVERSIGLNVNPSDIDVILVNTKEVMSGMIEGLLMEIDYLNLEDLIHEIYNEPKMLLCESSIDLEPYFDVTKVRSSVSNVCSKAYNKGKKKLIVSTDYDEYLGLKNLYHAMKFPYFAKWKFINKGYPPEDIEYLNNIRSKIFSTYEQSTGTLEERFESVNEWLKPEFNKVMTEFRKYFPKVKE